MASPRAYQNDEEPAAETAPFPGFERPTANYFRLPNDWTNITAGMATWAEHKVVEYVLRHTWGYQEYGLRRRITLDEFMHGRKRADGTRLDQGTGMGKKAIIDGIRAAVRQGYLEEEVDGTDPARVRKYYALRMAPGATLDDADEWGSMSEHRQFDDRTPDVRSPHPRGATSAHRTEKDTYERHHEKERGTPTLRSTSRGRRELAGAPAPERYSQGPYGVCPQCGCKPHDPECPTLARERRSS